ncbi:MAG: hypothetical protein ABIS35_06000 [Terracoccus sp.]
MKRPVSRRTTLTLSTAAVLVVGGGAAFAYWTTTGAGTGTADTGTTVAVVVHQTSTVTGLAPGVAPQSLSGNFDNPNAGPVYVAGVTATVTGTDKDGCTAGDYTIAGTSTVAAQVPAGNGVGAWSGLTIAFNNKASVNQDACKTAVVSLAYTSN